MHKEEELYEIRGDVADPSGSGLKGTSVGVDMTAGALAHPRIRWRDRVSEVDLYAAGDELMIHMYCPRCQNCNKISSKTKRITWSGDRLSVEEFACTWPECGLRIAIVDNKAVER